MQISKSGDAPVGRRSRGARAGLDLRQIIGAARSLPPTEVTMKAVADILGVDRSALNHYVSGREELLGLVATDAFSSRATAMVIPTDAGWQSACRAYAHGFCDALVGTGTLTEHFAASTHLTSGLVEPAEQVLTTMIAAGFADELAARSLRMLSNVCLGFARDVVLAAATGEHPQVRQIRSAIVGHPSEFPNVARIEQLGYESNDLDQLELSIDLFILGLDAMLGVESKR